MRPDHDQYFMAIAAVVATRSTCSRRSVGAVLVDSKHRILSTGYNGVAAGRPHCLETPCPGADYKSGSGLEACEAIHAEQNALIQCPDTTRIHTLYCTTAPCIHCTKMLLNTSCERIVFLEEYPHGRAVFLWQQAKREWIKHEHEQLATAVVTRRFSAFVGGGCSFAGLGDEGSQPPGEWTWGSKERW